jgi:putative addiction module component (TIGR02574 family)
VDESEIRELTTAEAEELDRRLDEMDMDPGVGIPWDVVLAKIRDNLKSCRPR